MGRISNDFVTIEYNNNYYKEIAEYYIKVFESNPKLYVGLLNGKKILHQEDLVNIDVTNQNNDLFNIEEICSSIAKLSTDKYFSYDFNDYEEYYAIYSYFNDKDVCENFQTNLAYGYFNHTEDFSYLKKNLFGDGLDKNDIKELCTFAIINDYEKIIRIHINRLLNDLKNSKNFYSSFIYNNLTGLSNLFMNYTMNLLSNKSMIEYDYNKIPKVNEKELNEITSIILSHIDPTHELLKEYNKYKDENKIEIIKNQNSDINNSCFYINNESDFGIKLYAYNDLRDVITLLHEFGHMHFSLINTPYNFLLESPFIFREYPSIYFERKAEELLYQFGYSKEGITNASNFRNEDNCVKITDMIPLLNALDTNKNKRIEEYDLSMYNNFNIQKEYLKKCGYDDNSIEQIINQKKYFDISGMMDNSIIEKSLRYLIGTVLADYSINNIDNEDCLKILSDIQFSNNPIDIIKKLGLKELGFVNKKTENILEYKKEDN